MEWKEGRASTCSQQGVHSATPRGTSITASTDEINEQNGINRKNDSSLKVTWRLQNLSLTPNIFKTVSSNEFFLNFSNQSC